MIQDASELSLEITRQDRVRDWPANDGEMIRPRAGRARATKLIVEPAKAFAKPMPFAVDYPTRSIFFKGLPIFVARIAVAELGGVHDPGQGVLGRGWVVLCVRADLRR
jgi:hypothetical protein